MTDDAQNTGFPNIKLDQVLACNPDAENYRLRALLENMAWLNHFMRELERASEILWRATEAFGNLPNPDAFDLPIRGLTESIRQFSECSRSFYASLTESLTPNFRHTMTAGRKEFLRISASFDSVSKRLSQSGVLLDKQRAYTLEAIDAHNLFRISTPTIEPDDFRSIRKVSMLEKDAAHGKTDFQAIYAKTKVLLDEFELVSHEFLVSAMPLDVQLSTTFQFTSIALANTLNTFTTKLNKAILNLSDNLLKIDLETALKKFIGRAVQFPMQINFEDTFPELLTPEDAARLAKEQPPAPKEQPLSARKSKPNHSKPKRRVSVGGPATATPKHTDNDSAAENRQANAAVPGNGDAATDQEQNTSDSSKRVRSVEEQPAKAGVDDSTTAHDEKREPSN